MTGRHTTVTPARRSEMGRKSKIEAHPQSEEIIRRLASGEEYSDIVRDIPGLTWDDLDYYQKINYQI